MEWQASSSREQTIALPQQGAGGGAGANSASVPPDDHPPTENGRAEARADLGPGTPVGEYLIEERIGEGAMGSVYRAFHPVLHKRAAIKVMRSFLAGDPDAIERFITEARALARVHHPNIVDVFSFGTLPDGRCFLGMEWLEGETLNGRLKRGPMALREALHLLEKVCLALEAAHAAGVVHRDLKPDNVFLAATGAPTPIVKLLDFSIAKLVEAGRPRLTRTGIMLGTPAYMAPEQVLGATVGPPADVYAMGILGFRALAGRLPFRSENAVELVQLHCRAVPPVLSPDVAPAALARLVTAMMDKDPSRRPTVAAVRAQLAAVAADLDGGHDSPTPAPEATVTPSAAARYTEAPRRKLIAPLTLFMSVTALVAAIVAAIAFWPSPRVVAAPPPRLEAAPSAPVVIQPIVHAPSPAPAPPVETYAPVVRPTRVEAPPPPARHPKPPRVVRAPRAPAEPRGTASKRSSSQRVVDRGGDLEMLDPY